VLGSSSKSKSTRHLKPSEIHSAVELYESYRQVSDPGAFEVFCCLIFAFERGGSKERQHERAT